MIKDFRIIFSADSKYTIQSNPIAYTVFSQIDYSTQKTRFLACGGGRSNIQILCLKCLRLFRNSKFVCECQFCCMSSDKRNRNFLATADRFTSFRYIHHHYIRYHSYIIYRFSWEILFIFIHWTLLFVK